MMRVRLRQFHIKGRKHSKIRLESRIIDLKDFKGLLRKIPIQCFHMLPTWHICWGVSRQFKNYLLWLPFPNPHFLLEAPGQSGCLFYIIVVWSNYLILYIWLPTCPNISPGLLFFSHLCPSYHEGWGSSQNVLQFVCVSLKAVNTGRACASPRLPAPQTIAPAWSLAACHQGGRGPYQPELGGFHPGLVHFWVHPHLGGLAFLTMNITLSTASLQHS